MRTTRQDWSLSNAHRGELACCLDLCPALDAHLTRKDSIEKTWRGGGVEVKSVYTLYDWAARCVCRAGSPTLQRQARPPRPVVALCLRAAKRSHASVAASASSAAPPPMSRGAPRSVRSDADCRRKLGRAHSPWRLLSEARTPWSVGSPHLRLTRARPRASRVGGILCGAPARAQWLRRHRFVAEGDRPRYSGSGARLLDATSDAQALFSTMALQ